MSISKGELIILSDTEGSDELNAEVNYEEQDIGDLGTPSNASFIPLDTVTDTDTDQLKNFSLKITEVKTLSGAKESIMGRPKNIRYRKLPTGQRVKIVPKRKSLDITDESPNQTSTSQSVAEASSSEPSTSTLNQSSRKRKAPHVTKPISDITFEESVEVVGDENTELIEYVACLRVALNTLLTEVDLPTIDLPGAIGKVKISEKVAQLIKEKEEAVNAEKKQRVQEGKPGPKSMKKKV